MVALGEIATVGYAIRLPAEAKALRDGTLGTVGRLFLFFVVHWVLGCGAGGIWFGTEGGT